MRTNIEWFFWSAEAYEVMAEAVLAARLAVDGDACDREVGAGAERLLEESFEVDCRVSESPEPEDSQL